MQEISPSSLKSTDIKRRSLKNTSSFINMTESITALSSLTRSITWGLPITLLYLSRQDCWMKTVSPSIRRPGTSLQRRQRPLRTRPAKQVLPLRPITIRAAGTSLTLHTRSEQNLWKKKTANGMRPLQVRKVLRHCSMSKI